MALSMSYKKSMKKTIDSGASSQAQTIKSFLTAQPPPKMEEQNSIEEFKSLYSKIQRLGQGAAGSAWLVKNNETGKKYVSKKIILDGKSEKEIIGCLNEVNLLRNLQSPSIVRYHQAFFSKGTLIIVMEYCEAGDLEYWINKKKRDGVAVNES